ncbi:MAG: hypothetical protein OXH11_14855 [Candidatus Aminicenantes bacterium]|nr:hypothetical protein [Candidatus Aminicenantes bacterium]
MDTTVHDEFIPRQALLYRRPVAALTEEVRVLDYYGGMTAALKGPIKLQPVAKNRSVKVMIDGYCTWQPTRLLGTPFGCA